MLYDRRELVRLVADARVVRQRDPSTLCHLPQPFVIRAIGRETINVPFYGKSRFAQDSGELQAKVAVGEEDSIQAARSYRTASSISSTVKS